MDNSTRTFPYTPWKEGRGKTKNSSFVLLPPSSATPSKSSDNITGSPTDPIPPQVHSGSIFTLRVNLHPPHLRVLRQPPHHPLKPVLCEQSTSWTTQRVLPALDFPCCLCLSTFSPTEPVPPTYSSQVSPGQEGVGRGGGGWARHFLLPRPE